jgi:sugar phosphate permease
MLSPGAQMNAANVRPKILSATTNVLILLCIMYALTYIDRNNVSTASFVFKEDLHLTNTEVAWSFPRLPIHILFFKLLEVGSATASVRAWL